MLTQFSTLYRSKMEIFAKQFFDIVTTYNDEICYVTHVLAPFYVFFTQGSALPPSPSTSVHSHADSKSAIPLLCVFHPIWVLGGGGGGAPKRSKAQLQNSFLIL